MSENDYEQGAKAAPKSDMGNKRENPVLHVLVIFKSTSFAKNKRYDQTMTMIWMRENDVILIRNSTATPY